MDAVQEQRIATFLLWASPALIASNYIIAKAASGQIAPHMMALVRWSVALCLMLLFSRGKLGFLLYLSGREILQMLVLGALGMWICGAFVYEAAISTSATNIALIYAVTPVAIAIANAHFHSNSNPNFNPNRKPNEGLRRFARPDWMGLFLAMVGVLFVISKGHPMRLFFTEWVAGDVWVLGAATSWVAYTLLMRRWPSTLSPSVRLCAVTAGGVLVLLPCTMVEALYQGGLYFTQRGLLLASIAGIVPGFMAYRAYAFLIHKRGPAQAGLVMYLSPIYAAIIAWVLLGEAPAWFHCVGAAMIFPSIYLATRDGERQKGARVP